MCGVCTTSQWSRHREQSQRRASTKKKKKVDAEVNAENLNYLPLQTLKPHTWFQVNSGGKVLGILIDATEPKRVMVYTTERRDKNVMFQ